MGPYFNNGLHHRAMGPAAPRTFQQLTTRLIRWIARPWLLTTSNSKPGRRLISTVWAYPDERISLLCGQDDLLEYLPTSNAFSVCSVPVSSPCPISIAFSNDKMKCHTFLMNRVSP